MNRSASEERFRKLLITAGFKEPEILEPDKDTSIVGTADFLVGDVVFEVKEIKPDKEEAAAIERLRENIKNKKVDAFAVPDKTRQFKQDIDSARKKFKAYDNYATVLVEDFTDWWWHEPDIEKMLFGIQAIHIDSQTGDVLGASWGGRVIRLDINRGIGSYIFITSSGVLIYHNLMAHEFKMMPVSYIQKFMRVTHQQFIFVNLPSQQALIRQIM